MASPWWRPMSVVRARLSGWPIVSWVLRSSSRPVTSSGLASALRSWLTDDAERRRLRRGALDRRADLPSWDDTVVAVHDALRSAALVGATTMTPTRLRRWLGPLAGAVVLALLVWRFGAEAFLDGVRRLDPASVAFALVVGFVTTVAAAWRWTVVAQGIGLRVPLRGAVTAYYRSQLVNVTVPGGVVGDVERAVRHGRGSGELAASVRSVGWERFGGQAVQLGADRRRPAGRAFGVPGGGGVGRGRARGAGGRPRGWPAPLPRGSGADA